MCLKLLILYYIACRCRLHENAKGCRSSGRLHKWFRQLSGRLGSSAVNGAKNGCDCRNSCPGFSASPAGQRFSGEVVDGIRTVGTVLLSELVCFGETSLSWSVVNHPAGDSPYRAEVCRLPDNSSARTKTPPAVDRANLLAQAFYRPLSVFFVLRSLLRPFVVNHGPPRKKKLRKAVPVVSWGRDVKSPSSRGQGFSRAGLATKPQR